MGVWSGRFPFCIALRLGVGGDGVSFSWGWVVRFLRIPDLDVGLPFSSPSPSPSPSNLNPEPEPELKTKGKSPLLTPISLNICWISSGVFLIIPVGAPICISFFGFAIFASLEFFASFVNGLENGDAKAN